jgi:hypothetical protein
MEEEKKRSIPTIDIGLLVKRLYERRRLFFFKVWPITFVVACFYIVCIPRYYTSDAKLAPEIASASGSGMLGSLASSFGINLGAMETSDAINPMLYPDLMEDNGFATAMFPVRVKTADGEIDTDYYTYLTSCQKTPWWSSVTKAISEAIGSLLPKDEEEENAKKNGSGQRSPYWLSKKEHSVAEAVRGSIHIGVNEKTGTISIQTQAQDPLVAKILADSVQAHLQQFITDYRTNKARIDVEHYEQLAKKARREYDSICRVYARFQETNTNIVLPRYQTAMENLQKDMQMKYTTYTTITAQLETAKAKLQERTPAFTQLKGASVPLLPAGPKRMLFVLFMLILATVVTAVVILRKELIKTITLS